MQMVPPRTEHELFTQLKHLCLTTREEIRCPRCRKWATEKSRHKYDWFGPIPGQEHPYSEMSEPLYQCLRSHAASCFHKVAAKAPPTVARPLSGDGPAHNPTNSIPPPGIDMSSPVDSIPPPGIDISSPADSSPSPCLGVASASELVVYEPDVDTNTDIMYINSLNIDELLALITQCTRRIQQLLRR